MFQFQLSKGVAVAALAGLLGVLSPSKSEAAFTAYVCDDVVCSGGNDFSLTDVDGDGIILLTGSFFNFSIVLNLAQSKPVLAQGMDLAYSVTSGATPGSVYLFAADTNFAGPASLSANWGGTNDLLGTSQAEICAGAVSTPSSPGSCVSSAFQPGGAFSTSFGPLLVPNNPYAAMLGIFVSVGAARSTASGDLRMNVPEPSTLALLGLAIVGLGAARRRMAR